MEWKEIALETAKYCIMTSWECLMSWIGTEAEATEKEDCGYDYVAHKHKKRAALTVPRFFTSCSMLQGPALPYSLHVHKHLAPNPSQTISD